MDDVTSGSSLHPGVAVIPAALAAAEECGASPRALCESIVAGYEVVTRVGAALNAASAYQRGFHPTGVAGVFGATAAVARIIGCDERGVVRALGIAGSLASGSLEYLSDGSWTKRLNAGWAGHAGVTAAFLALEGFTGPPTVFEGPLGLLHGYSDDAHPELLTAELGREYGVMAVSIKPYACCRYNHPIIDAALDLRGQHGITASEIKGIRLGVLTAGAGLVAWPIESKRSPRNVVDAQFSAPFAAAVALAHGAAGLGEYTQANIDDPMIRNLMAMTECFTDPALDARYPQHWPASVEVTLNDGRRVTSRIDDPTGEPSNPVELPRLIDKFDELSARVLPAQRSAELRELLLTIDEQPDLRRLGVLLRG
jgi:2-methylcitrate dehydratase PrpD